MAPTTLQIPVAAQSTASHPPPQAASGYSETILRGYVAATADMQRVADALSEAMEANQTVEQMQMRQRAARAEMAAAVERHGLTLEQYYEISDAVKSDREFARRIDRLRETPP
jgi:hypothetical protein